VLVLGGGLVVGLLAARTGEETFSQVGELIEDRPAADPLGHVADAPAGFVTAEFPDAINGPLTPAQVSTLINTGGELVGVDAPEGLSDAIRAEGRTWQNAETGETIVIVVMGFPGEGLDEDAFFGGASEAVESLGLEEFDSGIEHAKGYHGQFPQLDGSTVPGHQLAIVTSRFAATIVWLGGGEEVRPRLLELARRQRALM
jgi:hypothetical protein